MKKRTMKVLSLIVAIVMVVAMLPLSVLARVTGTVRDVGIVVYGSELTALLTSVETSIKDGKASIENGDAEAAVSTMKSSLDTLIELATSFSTGAIDGTGFSVPDLNIKVEDGTGKTYTMTEQPVEIFSQTAIIDLPFENDLDEALDEVEDQLVELQKILSDWKPVNENLDVIGVNDKIHDLSASISNFDFIKIADEVTKLTNQLVGKLAQLSGFEGKLYRTYVLEDKLVVGQTYTATISGFTDKDENGNPVTREGYVVYNDGLKDGSMFNTTRTFTFEVEGRGRFDHPIQFVGPAAGIVGTLDFGEDIGKAYDGIVTVINGLTNVLTETKKWMSDGIVAEAVKKVLDALIDADDLIDWFNELTIPALKDSKSIDKHYEFSFPGLWCAESDAGFAFQNVDVAGSGLKDANFLLVNRDETVDVLKMMLDLGKEVFSAVIKSTFGYTDAETGEKYDGMLNLYTQLINTEEGQITLDDEVAYDIIKNYIAVISQMELLDKVVDTNTGDLLTPVKLKNPIPAILMATADENGVVSFSKDSNKTLTWMLQIIPQVTSALAETSLVEENSILKLLVDVSDYASGLIAKYGDMVINTLVYPFAQRLGLVGQKFGSGSYVMFQFKAPSADDTGDYWLNPFAYTMNIKWTDAWCYVTVADLGIIGPYFAEGFYDFVRNTTFAGTIDKALSQLTQKDIHLVTDVLTDKIDITKVIGQESNKVLMGALSAFAGTVAYDTFDLDANFASRTDLISGINTYLYQNGKTVQNLMVYLNNQARKAKAVYAGDLEVEKDADGNPIYWQFYNLNKSPTTTATKLIKKSTEGIAKAFENQTKASVVTKVGTTVSNTVSKVGYKIEDTVKAIQNNIKTTIGTAIKSVAQKALDSLKTTASNFFKGLLSNVFGKKGTAMITFNA